MVESERRFICREKQAQSGRVLSNGLEGISLNPWAASLKLRPYPDLGSSIGIKMSTTCGTGQAEEQQRIVPLVLIQKQPIANKLCTSALSAQRQDLGPEPPHSCYIVSGHQPDIQRLISSELCSSVDTYCL